LTKKFGNLQKRISQLDSASKIGIGCKKSSEFIDEFWRNFIVTKNCAFAGVS